MSEQLTMEQVEFWLGSDMAQTEMIEILTELANGSYTQQNFKQDIKHVISKTQIDSSLECVIAELMER